MPTSAQPPAASITGILLAAGSSTRFGADKLGQPLGDGETVAVRAWRQLTTVIEDVIVVVRPDSALLEPLRTLGAHVVEFAGAAAGMGASLAHGVSTRPAASGWIVALADMPFIAPATIAAVAAALQRDGGIVAPTFDGRRGHPVGFDAAFGTELRALTGDQGARTIIDLHRQRLRLLPCADPGILHDIDTPADLA